MFRAPNVDTEKNYPLRGMTSSSDNLKSYYHIINIKSTSNKTTGQNFVQERLFSYYIFLLVFLTFCLYYTNVLCGEIYD